MCTRSSGRSSQVRTQEHPSTTPMSEGFPLARQSDDFAQQRSVLGRLVPSSDALVDTETFVPAAGLMSLRSHQHEEAQWSSKGRLR